MSKSSSVEHSQSARIAGLPGGGPMELDVGYWPWGHQELDLERNRRPGVDRTRTHHLGGDQMEGQSGLSRIRSDVLEVGLEGYS